MDSPHGVERTYLERTFTRDVTLISGRSPQQATLSLTTPPPGFAASRPAQAAARERCPALMGTAGYMPMECFCNETLEASPAQDVFAVAMVLLMACLKPEHRHQNLFTSEVSDGMSA